MNFYNHILDYIESELEKSEKMYELFKLNRTTEINMLPYDEIDLTDMSIDAEFTMTITITIINLLDLIAIQPFYWANL